MKQKHFFILLGAVGFVFLLCWFIVVVLVAKNLRGIQNKNNEATSIAADVTLCDVNGKNLCLISFGADSLNRMVIHFQLPSANYPPFYVKSTNRATVNVYTCVVENGPPTIADCTGVRTPLGEAIDIDVITTDDNKLIAHGAFMVSAIAMPTPISLPKPFIVEVPTAEEIFPSPVPTLIEVP
jgi:hypothetical protein